MTTNLTDPYDQKDVLPALTVLAAIVIVGLVVVFGV